MANFLYELRAFFFLLFGSVWLTLNIIKYATHSAKINNTINKPQIFLCVILMNPNGCEGKRHLEEY